MDKKLAVSAFQYGERSKSELMIASQLVTVLSGLKDGERAGGRKIVLQCLESVRIELQFALRATNMTDFQRAIDALLRVMTVMEQSDRSAHPSVQPRRLPSMPGRNLKSMNLFRTPSSEKFINRSPIRLYFSLAQ